MNDKPEVVTDNTVVIMNLIQQMDYLQLTALENAIQSRRYNMRKEAGKAFESIEKLGT